MTDYCLWACNKLCSALVAGPTRVQCVLGRVSVCVGHVTVTRSHRETPVGGAGGGTVSVTTTPVTTTRASSVEVGVTSITSS